MDASGNLVDMKGLSKAALNRFTNSGYLPVKKEMQASAGMMLKGKKKTKIDPKVFPLWTKGSAKKRKKAVTKAMERTYGQGT